MSAAEHFSLSLPPELVEAIADRLAAKMADRLPEPTRGYLDVDEAADYLRCPKSRIYELKAQGRLAHHRDGKRLLFRPEDLDAVLTRREAER